MNFLARLSNPYFIEVRFQNILMPNLVTEKPYVPKAEFRSLKGINDVGKMAKFHAFDNSFCNEDLSKSERCVESAESRKCIKIQMSGSIDYAGEI
jgi:hypothetical protein